MTRTPAISLQGVRKSYGGFVLGPVNLEIEPGCVVAVVGPNGGGKSTLFNMLMNLVQPDSGEISLFGGTYPQDEVAIKQRIGYVPERSVGHDEMDANSLGEFFSYWYPEWNQWLYEDLLKRAQVDPNRRFGELSRGLQRRLSFALALATGPELLLLDEPTAGVDPFASRQMLEAISRFVHDARRRDGKDRERTVLFATHVMEEARSIADHVVLLADGAFLGHYEKDPLLKQWKTLWVDREPEGDVPGVVEVEGGSPARLVTDAPQETAAALSTRNIRILRSQTLDLDEILSRLMQRSKQSAQRKVREAS